MEIIDIFQQPWAFRALLASVMVGLMCGFLGTFIVLRNMSMIGDALSHAVLPGVVVSFVLFGHNSLGLFLGAAFAGLLTAVSITWIQNHVRTKNDAAIGIVFTTMFSLGVIGISAISQKDGVHIDLKDFLFGNTLGVSDSDLQLSFSVLMMVIISIVVFYRSLFVSTFQPSIARVMGISVDMMHYFLMLLLSFAVVASLRTVGVILVVAMLITPSSTALLLSHNMRRVLLLSGLLGALAAIGGLLIAIFFDTTPGPAMAIVSAGMYLLAVAFAPQKGKLAQYLQKRQLKLKILREDIIKLLFKAQKSVSTSEIAEKLSSKTAVINRQISLLMKDNLLKTDGDHISLSSEGHNKALQLVRAHRLWETYLVDEMGLAEDQIHEEAEDLEHHLSQEMLDRVDALLGYPTSDPHGSPIPPATDRQPDEFQSWLKNRKRRIKAIQRDPKVMKFLWQNNLGPDLEIQVLQIDADHIVIEDLDGRKTKIPKKIASQLITQVIH